MRAGVRAPLGLWGEQGSPASALPVTGPGRAPPSIPSVLPLRWALSRVDPLESWAVQKQTTSLSVRVGHALPALSCPRTAASSTAAARPRSTRQTVRARARTRTSCSLSCKTCSGRTRSWRCACAGLMPSGALGSASLLTWGLWAWAAVSPSGRGSDTTESHPGPPTRGCWPQSHLGGPGDRPGAAARSAPQLTDRVSAEQENTPGKEGALQVHRGGGALPRGRQAC